MLSVMQVEFPVGMVIFNDKMGKILKTVFFLTCFIKFSQNSMMKKAESINQGNKFQGDRKLESHIKGEHFRITEVLLVFC